MPVKDDFRVGDRVEIISPGPHNGKEGLVKRVDSGSITLKWYDGFWRPHHLRRVPNLKTDFQVGDRVEFSDGGHGTVIPSRWRGGPMVCVRPDKRQQTGQYPKHGWYPRHLRKLPVKDSVAELSKDVSKLIKKQAAEREAAAEKLIKMVARPAARPTDPHGNVIPKVGEQISVCGMVGTVLHYDDPAQSVTIEFPDRVQTYVLDLKIMKYSNPEFTQHEPPPFLGFKKGDQVRVKKDRRLATVRANQQRTERYVAVSMKGTGLSKWFHEDDIEPVEPVSKPTKPRKPKPLKGKPGDVFRRKLDGVFFILIGRQRKAGFYPAVELAKIADDFDFALYNITVEDLNDENYEQEEIL